MTQAPGPESPAKGQAAPRPLPDLPAFPVQLAMAAVAATTFILWVNQDWGGPRATTVFANVASTVVPAGAAWACFERARRGGADLARAWRLIGFACLAWAFGQAAWAAHELRTGTAPATPSLADVGYLMFIPFATWGTILLGRTEGMRTGRLRQVLDGAITGSSLIFIAFVMGLEDIMAGSAQADAALLVNLLYPFGDAIVVSIVLLQLSRAPPGQRVPLGMLAAGAVLLTVADLWFLVVDAEGVYDTGGVIDAFWIMGFQSIGLAAGRPRTLVSAVPAPAQSSTLALLPLYPFLVAAVAACFAVARDGFLTANLFWSAFAVVLLVLARLMTMLLDNVDLNQRERKAMAALTAEKATRTRMMNAITHDMLNAMSPIRLQLHMFKRGMLGEPTPRQAESLAMVERNAEQMARLASDIKEASNVEEGRLAVLPGAMDLVALVRQCAASRQAEATQRAVGLEVLVPEGKDSLDWWGDAGRLTQLLDNLLSNALKFTPTGGKVQVRLAVDEAGATLDVTDSGRGLDAEEQAKLFQPYSQVHKAGEIKEHGTGLGLFISKGIAERHGGRIGARSAGHGAGSTFSVWLPAAGATRPGPLAAPASSKD